MCLCVTVSYTHLDVYKRQSGYLSDARGDHNEYQQGSQKAQRELDKGVGRSTVLSHKIDLYVGRIPSFPAGKQCNREAAQRHHDVRAEPVEEVEDDAVENLDLTPYEMCIRDRLQAGQKLPKSRPGRADRFCGKNGANRRQPPTGRFFAQRETELTVGLGFWRKFFRRRAVRSA